jgi:glutaconate CoA-transferase subunit A
MNPKFSNGLRFNCVKTDKKTKQAFEWWGPAPSAARKIAVRKSKALIDKRVSLKAAVSRYIKDAITIGIGGFVNTRVPVALVHEIIRQGAKDLSLAFQSNSICAELLAGAMLLYPRHFSVRRVELAWWGYEVIGIAPLLRHLAGKAMIQLDDYTNYGMSARFKAAAMGLDFIPVRDHGGSDMEHCRIFGALCTCPEIAIASAHSIVSTEQMISNENIRTYPNLTEIPYLAVDALVEQPFGAYPGVCYGNYWFDMAHIQMFRDASEEFRKSGNQDPLKKYYEDYIFGCETFDAFLNKIPREIFEKIKQLDGGQPIIVE